MSFLLGLEELAVKNNNSRATKTPLYELSVEEAREFVKVGDSRRNKPEGDTMQGLDLKLGKVKVAIGGVAGLPKGTSCLNTPAERVEEVTEALLKAVAAGEFDAAIAEAQAKIVPAAKVAEVAELPEDLDLSELDDLEETAKAAE